MCGVPFLSPARRTLPVRYVCVLSACLRCHALLRLLRKTLQPACGMGQAITSVPLNELACPLWEQFTSEGKVCTELYFTVSSEERFQLPMHPTLPLPSGKYQHGAQPPSPQPPLPPPPHTH